MADIFWKYATSGQAYVPLLLASTQNFASTGTVTLASTDATIIKDGSTWRALTNTPTAKAMGSKATFEVVWSASEATAKQTIIQIKDESAALIQDQQINIVTYGSSLAQHEFNLDQSIENSTMAAVVSVTSDVSGKVVGAVASVTGNVGGSVGSIASTAALPANVVEVKSSTANADTIVTNVDAAISSRMSSTRSTLGSTQAVASVTGNVGGNVTGSVGSIASTAALPSNLVEVKASTANTDTIVTNIDAAISSRLGTTVGAQLSTTAINAVSTGVKSEINDLIFTDASSQSTGGSGGSLGNKIAALNERFFNHHQQDSSTQVVMKSGSTSEVKFVMTVTNSSNFQTVQEATTA